MNKNKMNQNNENNGGRTNATSEAGFRFRSPAFKMTAAAVLVAISVIGSTFIHFQIGASKCTPVQHLVNVIAAVTLGPWYAVLTAFVTSVIRNILGIGTLLAFPGSLIGALLAGWFYKKSRVLLTASLGEMVGTGIIGGLIAWPVATLVMGNEVAALFFVVPFSVNAVVGSLMGGMLLKSAGMVRILGQRNIGMEKK